MPRSGRRCSTRSRPPGAATTRSSSAGDDLFAYLEVDDFAVFRAIDGRSAGQRPLAGRDGRADRPADRPGDRVPPAPRGDLPPRLTSRLADGPSSADESSRAGRARRVGRGRRRRWDRGVRGGCLPRRGRRAGHAHRARGARVGRIGRQFGCRPASVRPGPGGPLPRDPGPLPRAVGGRDRVPARGPSRRPLVRVGGRSRGPGRRPVPRRGLPGSRSRGRRRPRSGAARAGARTRPVGLPGGDRLPRPARGLHVCLCDAGGRARGRDPAGPHGSARLARRDGGRR